MRRKRLWLVAGNGTFVGLGCFLAAWPMLQKEKAGNERVSFEALKELFLDMQFGEKAEPERILGKPSRIELDAEGRKIGIYIGKRASNFWRPVIKCPLEGKGDVGWTSEYSPTICRKAL